MREITEIAKEYKEILATEETLKIQPGTSAGSKQKTKTDANASTTNLTHLNTINVWSAKRQTTGPISVLY